LSKNRLAVSELSCVNEAGIAMTPSCINPRDIPPVDSSESLSEIANIDIKRARKRALSGPISYSLSLSDSYHSLGLQTHLKWHLQKIEKEFVSLVGVNVEG
jgi:hypothetical protein